MKKKYILFNGLLGIMFLLPVFSCVPLDTEPYDRETDLSFWKKENSALYALNSCYHTLYSAEEVLYADAMTDNAYTKVQTGFNQAIGNGSYSIAYPYVESVWDSRYAGIRACNELLNNIDQVQGLTDDLRNRYRAEATVIRAFHYFELYSRFGDVPYFTKVITIKESQQLSRTPKDKIVTTILNELDNIISNNYLPSSYTADEDKGRITKWAAMALKARILLFEGRWEELYSVTSDIMSNGSFRLFHSYSGLFQVANENNEEVILDLQYISPGREYQTQYQFLPPSLKGYAQLVPLNELVQSYITDNGKAIDEPGANYNPKKPFEHRDPRLAATVCYSGNSYAFSDGTVHTVDCNPGSNPDGYGFSSSSSPTGYYIKKYWDCTYRDNLYSGLNIILIRYADILLMNAEALAEMGRLDKKAWDNTIRLIRERAGFTNEEALEFPENSNLIEIVRRERRSELALEGLRLKDIVRWRIADKVMNGYCHGIYTGEAVGTDNGYVRVENRIFEAKKHYLWPIPQNERDLNHNLTQNPNW